MSIRTKLTINLIVFALIALYMGGYELLYIAKDHYAG